MNTHTQATATTVRCAVVVEASIEQAFRVFTEDFDRFKPREHNMLEVEIAETVFELRVGGRVYDRGVDGSECQWARAKVTPSSNASRGGLTVRTSFPKWRKLQRLEVPQAPSRKRACWSSSKPQECQRRPSGEVPERPQRFAKGHETP